ncbi:MAG: hypothetical protein ISR98_02080 [Parcubacteria group bacterium]|nr:hypothetical protein [Parcubacteria group bacterium]
MIAITNSKLVSRSSGIGFLDILFFILFILVCPFFVFISSEAFVNSSTFRPVCLGVFIFVSLSAIAMLVWRDRNNTNKTKLWIWISLGFAIFLLEYFALVEVVLFRTVLSIPA